MTGRHHYESAKAAISAANKGAKNPNYGRVSPNASGVSLYNLDGVLVQQFSSIAAAAKWLDVSPSCVSMAKLRDEGPLLNLPFEYGYPSRYPKGIPPFGGWGSHPRVSLGVIAHHRYSAFYSGVRAILSVSNRIVLFYAFY